MFTLIFCTNRTDYINQQAIPRSRFAIALYQSNLRAIALYQSNLRAIAIHQSNLQAIALGQSNLQAIADYASPTGELALMNNQTISSHF
ncbi:hypothetical protein [Anabaena sp. AL09]|jgi:hypothetical protein|uniref:hypothetical protein n=1 Tax=Anabaena sp. AL09 TaxID=1710891 RepID=UPI00262F761B|nr:hypothetical protein [Anabaena sp. AL09]